jgi:GT2 family glycosyltransferase
MDYLPKISIGLVLYKGEQYLKTCLESLADQDYPNIEFLIRDQSPNGEAYNYVKDELYGLFQRLKLERGGNLWHSGGHNSLIRRMNGDYYIVASTDMWYPRNFVSEIVKAMEAPENRHYGSAACKLRVWNFDPESSSGGEKTNQLDSCGIGISPAHYFYDIGQGEEDKGQYDRRKNIFGPSGALSIFRRTALEDIAYKNVNGQKEYYDSLLHYKNDVDLAYRLQWAGHKSLFIPHVIAWHDRTAGNLHKSPIKAHKILKGMEDKTKFIKENSFFGQEVVLRKNYHPDYSSKVHFKTLGHKLARLGYAALKARYLLEQLNVVKDFQKEIESKQQNIKFRVPPSRIEQLMK